MAQVFGGEAGESKAIGRLVCFGFGGVAAALHPMLGRDWRVSATARGAEKAEGLRGLGVTPLPTAGPDLEAAARTATHVLISAPPGEGGCPGFAAMPPSPGAWIGYLSTTGVYGDLAGGWAFEETPVNPSSAIAAVRVLAERQWLSRGAQVFRLAGIYGPGRSALDRLRAGDARRIIKPGQVFSRIHVDDIARLLLASIAHPNPGRVYNVCDDWPAPPQDVIAHAAQLLGLPIPPDEPIETAALSPMAQRFYADSKRVSNARAKAELGWRPLYPTYREGLAALFAAEQHP